MAKIVDSDDYVGRRLRLRDLRVFFLVVEHGSLAKAAARLRVSQPAVSRIIADLEHNLGVRLFDRSTRGVHPTLYGRALLSRGRVAFDELRQGVRDIEFLTDPAAGEVRVGGPDVLMAGFTAATIDRLALESPRIVFHTVSGNSGSLNVALRQRNIDVVVSRQPRSIPEDDLASEKLFDEQFLIVVGLQNRWVRRRKINLGELLDEPWILPPRSSVAGTLVAEAFHAAGFAPPKSSVASDSIILRNLLLGTGRYISVLPGSILHFAPQQLQVKILPISLPGMIQPTGLTTLKNRTLSPVVERFIECARELAKSIARGPGNRTAPTKLNVV